MSCSVPAARRILETAVRAFCAERYEDAAGLFRRYLSLPDAVWRQERSDAMLCLAGCCCAADRPDETERWLLRACAEAIDRSAPWACLAAFYGENRLPDAAAVCAARANDRTARL